MIPHAASTYSLPPPVSSLFIGNEREYLFDPLRLVAHRGNWYALARKHPAGELRAFALSRFDSAKPTGETFVSPRGFDWRKASKDAFGIGLGIKPVNICFVFSRVVATAIIERTWHPTQRIRKRRDGSVELQMRAAPPSGASLATSAQSLRV